MPNTTAIIDQDVARETAARLLETGAQALVEISGWHFVGDSLIESARHNPRARQWLIEARAVLVAVGHEIPEDIIP